MRKTQGCVLIFMREEMIEPMYTLNIIQPGKKKNQKQPTAVLIEELYLSELNPGMASGFELASIGFYDE